uniref:Uncharacterized protein n=1 Tax=Panagrolaimus davidi TaxID=227884 RepID=A0A914PPB1_9BILA
MDDNRPINAPKEFQRDESLHVKPTQNPIDETKPEHERGHVHEALHKVKEHMKDAVEKVKGHDSTPGSTPDYYQC